MAHATHTAPAIADALSNAAAAAAPGAPDLASLQEVANALQSCDTQLARVVTVLDRLAQDTLALEHKPLARRPWELLARASRRQQTGALDLPRARLVALRELTSRFASAIDLLKGARAHLQPATVVVAQSTVATHLEVCRENLLEVSQIVGGMAPVQGGALALQAAKAGS